MQDPEPTGKERLTRISEWVVGVAGLILIVAGFLLTNLPKLSMDVSGSLRPNDLMTTMFSLSNEGPLPVYDVKAVCEVMRLDIPSRDRHLGPTTVYPPESSAEILFPAHKMTILVTTNLNDTSRESVPSPEFATARSSLPSMPAKAHPIGRVFAAASLAAIYRTLSRGAQPSGQRQSDLVSFADGGKKGHGSSAVSRTTGRPAEVLREASGIKSMGQRAMGSQ